MKKYFVAFFCLVIGFVSFPHAQAKGPRVGEIQDDEVDQVLRRQKSLNLLALGFGPYASSNVGDSKMLYGFSIGKHFEASTTAEIIAEALVATNADGYLGHMGLGFSFIPMTDQISPVLGAELGLGVGKAKDADGTFITRSGFSGQIHAGVRMFRLSTTQLEVLGTYTTIFSNAPSPNIYGAQLRLLF